MWYVDGVVRTVPVRDWAHAAEVAAEQVEAGYAAVYARDEGRVHVINTGFASKMVRVVAACG